MLDAGVLTTIQDLGRRNAARWGVSPSGAADWFSARVANRLVGNSDGAPLLEITLTGAAFLLEADARLAITGASAPVAAGGAPLAPWTSHDVRAGEKIAVGRAIRGLRSYVAFDGGIAVPPVMGSASTDLGGGFGGLGGRRLEEGDGFPLGPKSVAPAHHLALEASAIPAWPASVTLAATVGPDADWLEPALQRRLHDVEYRVSAASTRQAVRLESGAPEIAGSTGIVSTGVVSGCVQISSAGLPMVLLCEHQTTGGYATALCVITADLPRAAQLRPGDSVRFSRVGYGEAAEALDASVRKLGRLREVGGDARLSAGFSEGLT